MQTRSKLLLLSLVVCFASAAWPASAQTAATTPPVEEDYYRIVRIPIPEGIVLEAGGLEQLPNGMLAVSTRRGEIYLVENADADRPTEVKFHLFAQGLHEVLGLAYRDGWLYATQRCEVSRLKDTDGDLRADLIENVNDSWGVTGDYHEYAFGSKFDKDGNLWVTLCLTGSFNSNTEFRGWCLRINEQGEAVPTCSGIRSPGGMGMNAEGDVFYTDNQGPWNGTCSVKHLVPGSFQGHPAGNVWYDLAKNMGPRPQDPVSKSRLMVEADKIPELIPPPILLPYNKMGKSASGIVCDLSAGKFGVFEKQLFVGDQSHSTIMRCCLEKVAGRYQGACFMFREGFSSGNLAMMQSADGSLWVGGTNRGWGSRGREPFALERLEWTGKTPFEIHEMHAMPDGFELTFTEPVNPQTAADPASYQLSTYTYIYQSSYGSPEVDQTEPEVTKAVVGEDNQSVRLYVSQLQRGHVHELHSAGLRSASGQPLLHDVAYYTLNNIPTADEAAANR